MNFYVRMPSKEKIYYLCTVYGTNTVTNRNRGT